MDAARRRGAPGRLITSLAINSAEPVGGTWPWNRSWLYYTTHSNVSIPLDPGDRLLLYTDGLLETADQRGTFFGDARLFESLRDAASLNLPASFAHLIGKSRHGESS